jgi:hypothetical protein
MRFWQTVLILVVAGCGSGLLDGRSRQQPYSTSENALSLNGLVENGLLANGLQFNGLQFNGLQFNGLSVDSFSINGRSEGESLWILGYIVSCALPADHTLTVTIQGASYDLAGGLGLAPSFEFGALSDPTDQEWVSACLMARTNWKSSYGAPHTVAISLRGSHPNLIEPDPGFIYLDSGFFGNVFTSPARLYTCDSSNQSPVWELLDRGRLAGLFAESGSYFPGFVWGNSAASLNSSPSECWGHADIVYGSGVCNARYDGEGTIPDSDAFDASQGLSYDQAILSSCAGGGTTWTHPIFVTVDSLTDP